MTYCVGMMLDKGMAFMSDSRTNSGVDNVSVFRKMFHWEVPGERFITLLTAGNLATTQAVIAQLEERSKAPRRPQARDIGSSDDVSGRNLYRAIAARYNRCARDDRRDSSLNIQRVDDPGRTD